jgi:hypothetical protein
MYTERWQRHPLTYVGRGRFQHGPLTMFLSDFAKRMSVVRWMIPTVYVLSRLCADTYTHKNPYRPSIADPCPAVTLQLGPVQLNSRHRHSLLVSRF